jgi:hypothetical protein
MKKADFEKLSPEEQAALREKTREYNRKYLAARRAGMKAGEKPGKRGRKKKEAQAAGAEAAMPFIESLLKLPEKIAALETELKELLLDFEEVLRDNRQMKDFFKYGKKPEWGKERTKMEREMKKELRDEKAKNENLGQMKLELDRPPAKKEAAKQTDLPLWPRHEMERWAVEKGITPAAFHRWHEACEANEWRDNYGNPIRNWQNYLVKWPEIAAKQAEVK